MRNRLVIALVFVLLLVRLQDLRLAWVLDWNWGAKESVLSAANVGQQLGAYRTVAEYLRDQAAPEDCILLYDAGALAYFSGLCVIDTWSLTDVSILRWQRLGEVEAIREYVQARRPRWIVQDGIGYLDWSNDAYELKLEVVSLDWYPCTESRCQAVLRVWQLQQGDSVV